MKSKYETNVMPHIQKISGWVQKGATAKEIAGKLKVAYSTFRNYLDAGEKGDERYMALSAAFAQACEEPDNAVEAALYKKCLGYNAKIIKHYKLKRTEYDSNTGRRVSDVEELVAAEDEVHVSADTTAQMFWLTNRKATNWRYKPEPAAGDDDEGSGVVVLAPVMEHPPDPDVIGGADDAKSSVATTAEASCIDGSL
ncbi:MAG: hypothetical protein RR053_05545 [Evtepia sp.]